MTLARSGFCAFGLGAMLLAAGCGRTATTAAGNQAAPAPTAAAEALPNACDLLDAGLARKYLGEAAQLRRKAQLNPKMSQCQYGSDKGVITVIVGPWEMVHTPTPLDKPAAGVGEEAYNGPSGLYVRKGDRGVSINVMTMSGEFWGKAADDVEAQQAAAQLKVAPDLVARL